MKELHFKILHNIYPTNKFVSRFAAVDNKCEFCKIEEETIIHLFWECQYTMVFWKKVENYLNIQQNHEIKLEAKDVIFNYDNKNKTLHKIVNFLILKGKFHIHKAKFSKSRPAFAHFRIEFRKFFESIQIINKKKFIYIVDLLQEFFKEV